MPEQKWLTTSAGVMMPPIIYGTAWKKERTSALVVQAISAGFGGIDTACQPKHYNEPGIGEALVQLDARGVKRETLFLQTKFTPISGQDPDNVPYDRDSPVEQQVYQSFEKSKKNLNTDYVDSLVLHSPVSPYTELMKVWKAMENIHIAGGAHQLGISNCYDMEVMKAIHTDVEIKPAVLQNRFYQQTGYDTDLRDWCVRHGVIYQSFWTLTANPHLLASDTVRKVSEKCGKTESQILFRYLTQKGVVPLTGTCSSRHMKEDLDIFDFELSPQDMKAMSDLLYHA